MNIPTSIPEKKGINHSEKNEKRVEPSKKDFGGDTNRMKIIKEIDQLTQIDEVENFFSEKLTEAKEKFKSEINLIHNLEEPEEKKEAKIHFFSKRKTYYFKLNRVRVNGTGTKSGYRWELGSLKLKEGKETVEEILSQLREKIDDYETAPNKIQSEIVKLPDQDKLFQINFIKSIDKTVSGFIKEIGKDGKVIGEEKNGFVVKENINMLKLATKAKNMDKEDMYARIKQAMKKKPDVIEDIFFYLLMEQKLKLNGKNGTTSVSSLPSKK